MQGKPVGDLPGTVGALDLKEQEMSWKRMRFKNNKVWVAIGEDGNLITKKGKVLIKYQIDQDYEYWVHEKSVKSIDEKEVENQGTKKGIPGRKKKEKRKNRTGKKNEYQDETLYNDAICIYTDGASSGNPGPSGIGIFMRFHEYEMEISKHIGTATNNIAELEAIRTGLMKVKKPDLPVRVFTDSSYAYGVLTLGWKARKNQEIIKSTKRLISKFRDLEFIKVKGHAGHKGNERANLLATSAVAKTKT